MGSFSKTCKDYRPLPTLLVKEEHDKYCQSIFQDCCTTRKQNASCSLGVKAAEAGRSCRQVFGSVEEETTFTSCCQMCQLGLKSGSCFRPQVANFSDQAFIDCCSKPRNQNQDSHDFEDEASNNCSPGFMMKDKKCMNINECEEGSHVCRDDEVCIDDEGSYHCESVCNEGFKPFNNKCIPKTLCPSGYIFDSKQDTCVNVNECNNSPKVCSKGFVCFDTIGSFECIEDNCPPGKTLTFSESSDETSCEDLDECQEGQHHCDFENRYQVCKNLKPGYECVCAPGFRMNETSNRCIDINECREGTVCDEGTSYCSNTIGSFQCLCREGFEKTWDGSCLPGVLRDASGVRHLSKSLKINGSSASAKTASSLLEIFSMCLLLLLIKMY